MSRAPRDVPFGERTVPALLERGAALWADKPFVVFAGEASSFARTRDRIAARAGTLAGAGVEPSDRVALLCRNGPALLETVLACGWLGAVAVPLNVAVRGAQLQHALANSAPRLLVVEPELEPLVSWAGIRVWLADALPPAAGPVPPSPVRPGDTFAILYTSGTTGVSKGVQCPHAQFFWWGLLVGELLELREDDILYTVLPLFHSNALGAFFQALLAGTTFHVGSRFSASAFWGEVSKAEATVTYLLGAMVQILLKRPSSRVERAHRLRIALAPSTQAEALARFRERFDVDLLDAYGSTESNAVIGATIGEQRPGTMGRVLPGFEARVADEDDNELPPGEPGELLLRHSEPFSFGTGYWAMPERTTTAWCNLWLHTGDRVVREPDGRFRFVDRLGDAIRRRGENISSWEVEQALLGHPSVAAVAVVPVPSELGEDDVLACVVLQPGADAVPEELVRHCEGRLATFATPRYVDILPELPLTENGKVRKFVLRERGVTATAWDREAARERA